MDDRQQTRRFWGLIAFAALALLGFLSGSFVMLGIGALGLLFVVLALPRASSGLSAPAAKRSRFILQDVKIAVAARPQSPTAVELTHRLGMVRHMSGPQFERFVADVLGGWDTGPPS
jgi:hypothetical protein